MKDLICIMLVFVALFSLIIFAALWAEGQRCTIRWQDTNVSEFSILGGCMVKLEGQWVPEDRIGFVSVR